MSNWMDKPGKWYTGKDGDIHYRFGWQDWLILFSPVLMILFIFLLPYSAVVLPFLLLISVIDFWKYCKEENPKSK